MIHLVLLLRMLTGLASDQEIELPRIPPQEPPAAVTSFDIDPAFEMQLLAAEPLVTDPVAMEYDEYGRAWVAEMRDYPYTDKDAEKPFTEKTGDLPLGRIRLLEDTNADGVFDRSTVFAEDLSWPTGLAVWKGGLFVVATPDLWYLKDTDGDRRADVRRKVLTGFRKFNVQAVINNLKWGMDHRLYGAGSSNGGRIRKADLTNSEPLVMTAGDFRFDPNDVLSTFELLPGGARFGNTFDDWGHRFICNIRNPIQQVVLHRRYLSRNPYAAYRSSVHDVAVSGDSVPVWRSSPPEPWRIMNSRRLANNPAVASPRSETVAAGYMTSASGVTIYRGDAYPKEYYGTVFLGEVAGNLIHHQRLTQQGPAFTSERTRQESEFLASRDNWFRPVNFVNAPDGTLHVLDMYRETIEHPWSIPDDIRARLDLESGRDRGRIYRLAPKGFRSPPLPMPAEASVAELVAYLSSPRSWYRDTAHRLIFERQDSQAIPLLRELLNSAGARAGAAETQAEDPDRKAAARLLALWSLQGLNALSTDDVATSLRDPHPAVRVNGTLLAETFLQSDQRLREMVCDLCRDTDAEVRFQATLSLGDVLTASEAAQPKVIQGVAEVGVRDAQDSFTEAAVLSSSGVHTVAVLETVLQQLKAQQQELTPEHRAAVVNLVRHLAFVPGAKADSQEIRNLLTVVSSVDIDNAEVDLLPAIAVGLGQGLKRSGGSLRKLLDEESNPGSARLSETFAQTIDRLSQHRGETRLSDQQTAMLAELLAFADYQQVARLMESWLNPQQTSDLQTLAVRVLAGHRSEDTCSRLISHYRSLHSSARIEIVDALLSRPEWHTQLLAAVQEGTIPLFDIPHLRRNLLLRSRNSDVQRLAVELFSESLSARRDVVDRYRELLPQMTAERERGELVYRRECRTCHRVGNAGQDLGPNLTTIRHRAPDEVLLHILDPNREVAPNYIAQTVVTSDGQALSGLVTDETADQITLKLSTGTETLISRSSIEEIASTGQSLMPVGFEQKISVQEMADLLEFLLR